MATPILPNTHLNAVDQPPTEHEMQDMKRYPFRQVVWSLHYLARVTRPGISFTVN